MGEKYLDSVRKGRARLRKERCCGLQTFSSLYNKKMKSFRYAQDATNTVNNTVILQ